MSDKPRRCPKCNALAYECIIKSGSYKGEAGFGCPLWFKIFRDSFHPKEQLFGYTVLLTDLIEHMTLNQLDKMSELDDNFNFWTNPDYKPDDDSEE